MESRQHSLDHARVPGSRQCVLNTATTSMIFGSGSSRHGFSMAQSNTSARTPTLHCTHLQMLTCALNHWRHA
jgi:hypothetical protein